MGKFHGHKWRERERGQWNQRKGARTTDSFSPALVGRWENDVFVVYL